jgi:predicted SAM-dependent methyltransferase
MKTKINIGSGAKPMAKPDNEWEDLDIRERVNPTILSDCRDIPKPNNSYEYVFVNSVLEHFSKWERFDCLKEWYRILKQDGIIYISVPDMELLAIGLFKNSPEKIINFIYGEQNYSENQHKWGYTKKTIENDLKDVGFKDIQFKKPKKYDYELIVIAKK